MAAPTLLYTPTSCGGASYISAHKAGLIASGKIVALKCDTQKHVVTSTGQSMYEINPKGNVPALKFADGVLLNEGAAVLQYIADLAPEAKLAPPNGTIARYQLQNELNFLSSEVHATYGPLFGPGTDEFKAAQKAKLATKYAMLEKKLEKSPYLLGADFTVADAYLYVMLGWAGYVGADLTPFPAVQAFRKNVGELPFVVEANAAMNAAA